MPHFKDTKGGLFWLDPADVPAWKRPDWQAITEAEAEAIREANRPKPSRADEIRQRLVVIDAESIRALRATMAASGRGKPAPVADVDKLAALEAEAQSLRLELAALPV